MNIRHHLYKFQFSHFEEPEGSATAMFHRLTSGMSRKQLYIQFLWQLCLFLLTLNVSASMYQAIERHYVENTNKGGLGTQKDLIDSFSSTHNISKELVNQLLLDLEKVNDDADKPPRYLDAIILALSTFFTIGKYLFCCIRLLNVSS